MKEYRWIGLFPQAGSVQRRSERATQGSADDASKKLREAEQKMQDLTAAMAVLGKEAASSLISVETQQQRVTLQRLIDAVRSEKEYHARSAELLEQVYMQVRRYFLVSEVPANDKLCMVELHVRSCL